MRREVPTFSKFHGTQPARAVFADPFAPRLRICHAPNSALPAVVLKDGVRTADTQLAAALRKRGLTMAAAAKQLGVAVSMLYAWKKPPKGARMVPVKIVPAAMAAPSALTITTVRMLSPRGYWVEVPNVATAVALLRELG